MRKVIVQSLPGGAGKAAGSFSQKDISCFRTRLDEHVDKFNDGQPAGLAPDDVRAKKIRYYEPEVVLHDIVVVPRDEFSGSRIINIVNNLLKLPGHKLTAAWNSVLPKTAEIVLRYRSAAGRSAEVIVNDPKKGIAGMNDWQLTGKEIDLVSHWPDGKDSSVTFALVRVSARICGLIQAQPV